MTRYVEEAKANQAATATAPPPPPPAAPAVGEPNPLTEPYTRVQKGALADAPEFYNPATHLVQIFDEDKRSFDVVPDYMRSRRGGITPDTVFRVKGEHYRQFVHPYGPLIPFRSGAPTAGVAAAAVAQAPPVPHSGSVTALPPDHWSQNRPDPQPAAPAPVGADDPEADASDPLAPDVGFINQLAAEIPADASEQDRTEVVSTVLKRRRGLDANLPQNLEKFQPLVDKYAPTVATSDPVPAATSDTVSQPAAKAAPAPKPKPVKK